VGAVAGSGAATQDADAGRVSPARARLALGVLVVVYAVNFIDRNILAVLLQPIKEELGASDTAMGVLTGFAFAVFYTFAGIPIARLADRGSRRTVMAVGVAFWSLATAASGLARSYAQLAAARIAVGIGEASATPAAHSLISDYFPPRQRTRALAIYNMGASAGVLFGLFLGGWLQTTFGWRVAFAVVGLPGLAIALVVRFAIPEPVRGGSEGLLDAGGSDRARETLRHLAALPSFRHLCAAAALYGVGAYGLINWAPTFMIRVHALSYAEVGLWLGLAIGVGGGVGALASGALRDRLAARDARWLVGVPAIAGVALVPFLLGFLLAPDAGVSVAAFVFVNLLNVVFAAPTYAIVQGLARLRMRATAVAIVSVTGSGVGSGIGPLLTGEMNVHFAAAYGDEAVRYALVWLTSAFLVATIASLLAARTLRSDLARSRGEDEAHETARVAAPGVAGG